MAGEPGRAVQEISSTSGWLACKMCVGPSWKQKNIEINDTVYIVFNSQPWGLSTGIIIIIIIITTGLLKTLWL